MSEALRCLRCKLKFGDNYDFFQVEDKRKKGFVEVVCKGCGYIMKFDKEGELIDSPSWEVYEKNKGELICDYCGKSRPMAYITFREVLLIIDGIYFHPKLVMRRISCCIDKGPCASKMEKETESLSG